MKLILIDGIPGSGKSTLAHFLAHQFSLNGIEARWFHELEPENPLFDPQYMKTRKIVSIDEFTERNLALWSGLVKKIDSDDLVYIIDSYLFQSTIGHLFDSAFDENSILQYAEKVPPILTKVNPFIVYFKQANTKKALYNLEKVRGEQWVDQRVKNQQSCPYAIKHNLQDFDGWVTMLSKRAELCERILASYPFQKIIIDPTKGDWNSYYNQILDFIGIDYVQEEKLPIEILERYQGKYQIVNSEFTCDIRIIDSGLYIFNFLHKEFQLLQKEGLLFEVESTPYIITFHQSPEGTIRGMTFDGSRLDENDTYELEWLS